MSEKIRLLVIDESPEYFESLKECAEMCSHQYSIDCRYSDTEKDALSVAKKWEPEVIILDIHLGDSTGFDLVQRLRESPAQIIVASSKPSMEICESALSKGALAYVAKDDDPEELEKVLMQVALASNVGQATH